MLRHCLLFIGLIALWITSCSRTPEYTDSAARLAERIVPSHSDDFIFTQSVNRFISKPLNPCGII